MMDMQQNQLDRERKLALLKKKLKGKSEEEMIAPSISSLVDPESTSNALSYAQQRLWFLDQIEGGTPHYNIFMGVRLIGDLDHEALDKSLTTIVERHSSLRTCFHKAADDTVAQVILPMNEFHVRFDDLSHVDEALRDLAISDVVALESGYSFDLASEFMIRVKLVKLSDLDHILLVTMHHIASDGWSVSVLLNEFTTLYRAYKDGLDSPLDDLAIQYLDYARWQRAWLKGDVLDKQLSYWRNQLADLPIVHGLPLDRPRPMVQSFSGDRHVSYINQSVTQKLKEFCSVVDATLFMGLHAAFSVLLSRFSGETDIVMGTTVANREQPEVASLIGLFINNLVLRSNLSGSPAFSDILEQSRSILLEAYAHQQTPFEQIVETLQPERSLSHSPLFQVMLILQNQAMGKLDLPGLYLQDLGQKVGVSKYDITLTVIEIDSSLELSWEYNTDIFNDLTIECMAESFGALLPSLLDNPERSAFLSDFTSKREITTQLDAIYDNQHDVPISLFVQTLFEMQVDRIPDSVAVVVNGRSLTYSEINAKANQMAHYLVEVKKVQRDELIGICIRRSPEMLIGLLAILKAGGAYLPLDPDYPAERLSYMVNDSQVTTVLSVTSLKGLLPIDDEQVVYLDGKDFQQQLTALPKNNIPPQMLGLVPEHLAYVIYTSGSTGRPKGVMIEHGSLINFLLSMEKKPGITEHDALLAVTSISFDIHTLELYLPLICGAKLVIATDEQTRSAGALHQLIESEEVSVMQATPTTWSSLIQGSWPHPKLKAFCGGEALGELLKEALCDIEGVELWNMYGPTETSVWSAVNVLRQGVSVSIGRPIANTQFYVLDKQLQLLPKGVVGELYIGGLGLSRGYLNNPTLTAERFIPNPFHDPHNQASSARLYRTGD
ncbi:MAG: amino acid adenylation domain-containing protein, partial [Cellvibrio sp.]|uniref:non-ribosomal peptide synthetase n=1 Tax=Cellvibrio sp. TaxID=1965322 RepID=UPI0027236FC7|nr:amino acid adenylation domain-containing protein [Cellvibrio sp.]